uniref:Uncharacterized protein n=1 Tax=Oryza punctata TaxID=4537 RepID=A0A0E0M6E3_ORYPU
MDGVEVSTMHAGANGDPGGNEAACPTAHELVTEVHVGQQQRQSIGRSVDCRLKQYCSNQRFGGSHLDWMPENEGTNYEGLNILYTIKTIFNRN